MKSFVDSWKSGKPTERQCTAINNMRSALGWTCKTPKTKSKASELIKEMHEEIVKRLSITGCIRRVDTFDDAPDPWGMDEVDEPWMWPDEEGWGDR
jgi:hypothetical protein